MSTGYNMQTSPEVQGPAAYMAAASATGRRITMGQNYMGLGLQQTGLTAALADPGVPASISSAIIDSMHCLSGAMVPPKKLENGPAPVVSLGARAENTRPIGPQRKPGGFDGPG